MTKPIRVLIAEDHDVVREGLRALISADPRLRIAGEAKDGDAAVRLARDLCPDVVLMDLAMPNGGGFKAARNVCRDLPDAKVLVLSAYHDEQTVQQLIAAGVAGYLTKHSAAEELLKAIHEVVHGQPYFGSAIAGRLRARQRFSFETGRPESTGALLTGREQEVLGLIAAGLANKQIASELGLSVKTVEKHRQAAMDKLNIHDTAGLTRYAVERGLASLPPGTTAPAGPPRVGL